MRIFCDVVALCVCFSVHHSIFNPWDAAKHAHSGCLIRGSMAMAPMKGACAEYIMNDAVGSDSSKWTDGDMRASLGGEGVVTGHGWVHTRRQSCHHEHKSVFVFCFF